MEFEYPVFRSHLYLSLFTFLQYDDDERHSTSRSRSASQLDNRDEETSQLDNREEETSQLDNPDDDEDEISQFEEGSQEEENDDDEEMEDSKMVDVSYKHRQTWASSRSIHRGTCQPPILKLALFWGVIEAFAPSE